MPKQTPNVLVEEIRAAFASARTAQGEHLLLEALESGVPWDVATRAVAEGVIARFDSSEPGTAQSAAALRSAPGSSPRASV
jgi:hypothetical protein